MVLVLFFFKQKTAYEMRISDWSSDVCSSDLPLPSATARRPATCWTGPRRLTRKTRDCSRLTGAGTTGSGVLPKPATASRWPGSSIRRGWRTTSRSEEHTSELQSLMRISYAVFCLKKKTNNNHTQRAALPDLTRQQHTIFCYTPAHKELLHEIQHTTI